MSSYCCSLVASASSSSCCVCRILLFFSSSCPSSVVIRSEISISLLFKAEILLSTFPFDCFRSSIASFASASSFSNCCFSLSASFREVVDDSFAEVAATCRVAPVPRSNARPNATILYKWTLFFILFILYFQMFPNGNPASYKSNPHT